MFSVGRGNSSFFVSSELPLGQVPLYPIQRPFLNLSLIDNEALQRSFLSATVCGRIKQIRRQIL